MSNEEIPLCGYHAEEWFTARNVLASQECVVCAFGNARAELVEALNKARMWLMDEHSADNPCNCDECTYLANTLRKAGAL